MMNIQKEILSKFYQPEDIQGKEYVIKKRPYYDCIMHLKCYGVSFEAKHIDERYCKYCKEYLT